MGSWCGGSSSSKYGSPYGGYPQAGPYGAAPYGASPYGAPALSPYGPVGIAPPPMGLAPGPAYGGVPVGASGPMVPVGPPQYVGMSPNPPPGYTSGRGCC